MKKAAIATLISATLGLAACQQQAVDPLAVEQQTLETDEQKQAYALGASVGNFVEQKLAGQAEAGIELDKAMILKGFVAAIQGQAQMNQNEMREFTSMVDQKVREAQQALAAKQGEENLAAGQAYLAENAKREGVIQTETGLQYEVMTAAGGNTPSAEDTVKVHYRGTLLDGTEFDSSYSRGEPAVFPLHRVIAGWTEGLQLMNVGSKFKFHIPSDLAYGARSTGKITPNSTLIFEVELLEIVGQEVTE